MTVHRGKPTAEKPARRAKEVEVKKRTDNPPRDRPRPPEPFEECGPTGGYGGAGMDDEKKE
jgi:hypothetical protein